jgi:hypothetical protein
MANVLNYSLAAAAGRTRRSPDATVLVAAGLLAAALIIVAFSSFFSTGIDPDALASMANNYP